MFGPFRKEKPLQGFMGFGGGAASISRSGAPRGDNATGGIVAEYTSPTSPTTFYRVHMFIGSGIFQVNSPTIGPTVELIHWGGGGGSAKQSNSGGGGAGGYLETPTFSVSNNPGTYTVTIGAGGAIYQSGWNTTITGATAAAGGGRGGEGGSASTSTNEAGQVGGSGGGGGNYGSSGGAAGEGAKYPATDPTAPAAAPGQGNDGGAMGTPHSGASPSSNRVAGGGGGAGGVGADGGLGPTATAPGGIGKQFPATWRNDAVTLGETGPTSPAHWVCGGGGGGGIDTVSPGGGPGGPYAGGGNGGGQPAPAPPSWPTFTGQASNGFAHSGGGAGGKGYTNSGSLATGGGGAHGGSGGLMIRYPIDALTATAAATGGAISFTPTHTIHVFTGTGTFVTPGPFSKDCEYVIVAGGGSGGSSHKHGGGAGGYLTGTTSIGGPLSLNVTVGAGAAQYPIEKDWYGAGTRGSNSSVNFPGGTVECTGGGAGMGDGRAGG